MYLATTGPAILCRRRGDYTSKTVINSLHWGMKTCLTQVQLKAGFIQNVTSGTILPYMVVETLRPHMGETGLKRHCLADTSSLTVNIAPIMSL